MSRRRMRRLPTPVVATVAYAVLATIAGVASGELGRIGPGRAGEVVPIVVLAGLTSPFVYRLQVRRRRSFGKAAAVEQQLAGAQRRLAHVMLHDPLTGLPNRSLFADHVARSLACRARRGSPVAVLVCDLDRFKAVNDSSSHGVGDEVLVQVAHRLVGVVGASDAVARLGSDEFAVLLERVQGRSQAVAAAERLRAAFHAPFAVTGREVFLTASVGIAIAGDEAAPDELLRAADAAMYAAKEHGRDTQVVFDDALRARVAEQVGVDSGLRRALAGDELEVHYQPVIDLRSGRPRGAEALVRWRDPERGLLGPAAFLGIAEQTGLIEPIGSWVLTEACRTMQRLRRRTGLDLDISVNVSARQLRAPGAFVDMVGAALTSSGLPHDRLVLELTETVMIDELTTGLDDLRTLTAAGVGLAVDDFGTGYASLAYLKRLPVTILKIDRSFVDRLDRAGHATEDAAIVSAITGLAGSLGFVTVAEGVERAAQAEQLRHCGAHLGQGYLWSPALPPGALRAWLRNTRRGSSSAGVSGSASMS